MIPHLSSFPQQSQQKEQLEVLVTRDPEDLLLQTNPHFSQEARGKEGHCQQKGGPKIWTFLSATKPWLRLVDLVWRE